MVKKLLGVFSFLTIVQFAMSADRTIVIPTAGDKCKVSKDEIVRVHGEGIAGSKIEVKIDGPAKIANESVIIKPVKGGRLVGKLEKEFDIKPTGKGKVTVTITVTPPQPGAKPEVTIIEFEVE